jgi:recombination protein RecR
MLPDVLKKLSELISFLPWIGEKTAVKLAFFLLKANPSYVQKFADTLRDIQAQLHECSTCHGLTDTKYHECAICRESLRKTEVLCIVEDYLDMVAIERLGIHKGRYHVLDGIISPLSGKSPKDLNMSDLMNRVSSEWIQEIILAFNPNIEWEATSLYIEELFSGKDIKITRLSRWLPNAGFIEYADEITLISAFRGRG